MKFSFCSAARARRDRTLIASTAVSSAEPAPDRFPRFGMIADHAQRRGDGNGQNQAHASPYPAPEKQCNGDSHGIQPHAATYQLRSEEHTSELQSPDHIV